MLCDSAEAQQEAGGIVKITTGMRSLTRSNLENGWLKMTLYFLCSSQLQRPKDISTDREHDGFWSKLIPGRARNLAWTKAWTKSWTKRRGQERKLESSQIISQPALSVMVSWLSSLKALLSQVLAKLKGLAWLDGTTNLTNRPQICTLFYINMPDK